MDGMGSGGLSLRPRGAAATAEEGDEDDRGCVFEEFGPAVNASRIPIVVFDDDVRQQLVWLRGNVVDGRVQCPAGPPDVHARDPVVMSPAYLGFAVEPYETRYLHYRDVGIVFAQPYRATFMQPSIDTILVCRALGSLLGEPQTRTFNHVIDVGGGSGFIGKFAAVHMPGEGALDVTLVDIDKHAVEYWRSPGFGARERGDTGRPLSWHFHACDAAQLLQQHSSDFDLIVSNPPYIPTEAEVAGDVNTASPGSSFWEGCGLLAHLLEGFLQGRYPGHAHLVVATTSLTLKSRRVRSLLEQAEGKHVSVRVLLEREVAWKAWYAGPGGSPTHLLATEREKSSKQQIGQCAYYVGATRPGQSRCKGDRNGMLGYHWHVAYILDLSRGSDKWL